LSAGADVNAKNAFGYTALMWSVTEPGKAGLLIAHEADVNAKSRTGRTALIIAAMQNDSNADGREPHSAISETRGEEESAVPLRPQFLLQDNGLKSQFAQTASSLMNGPLFSIRTLLPKSI
jgi:hypothetical protein